MSEYSRSETPKQTSETRIAVVMYGGISLAIYIFGVARELYSLVRATATTGNQEEWAVKDSGDNKLTPTEKVYSEIGEKLKTKFVVDILSGT